MFGEELSKYRLRDPLPRKVLYEQGEELLLE